MGIVASHARLLRERGARHLSRHGGGIDVQTRDTLPGRRGRDVDAVIMGRAEAAAMPAIANPREVAEFRHAATEADEGGVHLRIAVLRAVKDGLKLRGLCRGHDQLVERRNPGVGRVIHLEQGIGHLPKIATAKIRGIDRRGRPGSSAALGIRRLDVVLDQVVVLQAVQQHAVNPVACSAIRVRAIIEHGRGTETRR